VSGLAGGLEGDIIGRVALDFNGGLRDVVEVFVEEIVGGLGQVGECWDRHLECEFGGKMG